MTSLWREKCLQVSHLLWRTKHDIFYSYHYFKVTVIWRLQWKISVSVTLWRVTRCRYYEVNLWHLYGRQLRFHCEIIMSVALWRAPKLHHSEILWLMTKQYSWWLYNSLQIAISWHHRCHVIWWLVPMQRCERLSREVSKRWSLESKNVLSSYHHMLTRHLVTVMVK